MSEFQSTFPQGERLHVTGLLLHVDVFQSTFPQGERLGRSIVATMELSFQSTFPQGERRFYASYIDSRKIISIHVPTRGTTRAIIETKDDTKDFNPRSHKGNDICSLKSGGADPDISIHVPTRGTTTAMHLITEDQRFQSTFPQGERP